jgi:hypothetical protein
MRFPDRMMRFAVKWKQRYSDRDLSALRGCRREIQSAAVQLTFGLIRGTISGPRELQAGLRFYF